MSWASIAASVSSVSSRAMRELSPCAHTPRVHLRLLPGTSSSLFIILVIWKPTHTWFEIQFILGQVWPEPI